MRRDVPDAQHAIEAPPERLPAVAGEGAAGERDVGNLVVVELAAGVEIPEAEVMIDDPATQGMAAIG